MFVFCNNLGVIKKCWRGIDAEACKPAMLVTLKQKEAISPLGAKF